MTYVMKCPMYKACQKHLFVMQNDSMVFIASILQFFHKLWKNLIYKIFHKLWKDYTLICFLFRGLTGIH